MGFMPHPNPASGSIQKLGWFTHWVGHTGPEVWMAGKYILNVPIE